MRTMNKRIVTLTTTLTTALASALSVTNVAFATDLEIMHEYQSNPYQLSDDYRGSRLINARIFHQENIELPKRREIQISGELDHERFLDVTDADNTSARIRGRLVNRLKLGDKSASLLFTADAGTKRFSYIDQRTGNPLQTSRGGDIRARFAYNFVKPSAEFTYRWNRNLSTGVFTAFERRDYVNDYDELGLEALDYTEITIQPTLRFKTENSYSRVFVYQRQRDYDERQVDNLQGRNIPGTRLSLTLRGYGLSHRRDLSETWTVEAYLSGYDITDNGVGYTNQNVTNLNLTSKHRFDNSRSLDLMGRCSRRDNENIRFVDFETTEFGRLQTGCQFTAGYEQPIRQDNKRLRWRVEASRGWEDNTESLRSFDQWGLSFGVNYRW